MAGGGRTLVVNLIADTSKFGHSMQNAQKDVGGFKGAISKLGSMVGPALIGAAAAAGALAVKFGVDGVQAALDEQQAVAKLGQTLSKLGLGEQTQAVEDWIDATQRATGVADDQLRPAFTRLVTSTGDAQKAQDLLNVAIDTATATGKPLETVVNALGKAADGSTGAIGKLGVGIDKAALKTMDLDDITKTLSQRFGGAASANAETYKGKVALLSVGFDELKESFGQGFLDGLGNADSGVDTLTTSMKDLEPAMQAVGTGIGELITLAGNLTAAYTNVVTTYKQFHDAIDSPVAQKAVEGATSRLWGLVNPALGVASAIADATKQERIFNDVTGTATFDQFLKDLHELELGFLNLSNAITGAHMSANNYGSTQGGRRPGTAQQGNLDNEPYYGSTSGRGNRSALDKGGPQIIIQAGIGDPVAIAREVERVLRLQDTRLGPS